MSRVRTPSPAPISSRAAKSYARRRWSLPSGASPSGCLVAASCVSGAQHWLVRGPPPTHFMARRRLHRLPSGSGRRTSNHFAPTQRLHAHRSDHTSPRNRFRARRADTPGCKTYPALGWCIKLCWGMTGSFPARISSPNRSPSARAALLVIISVAVHG